MTEKGLLIVLSGPSGCGKGTILKELLKKRDDTVISISATTRSPREGEMHSVHYYFISKSEFEDRITNDGMLEYAEYVGNYYGTPAKEVYENLENGKNVILEIEVQGAMKVKQKYKDAVMIFVMPPSVSELRRRLVDRATEDLEKIDGRMNTAMKEMKLASQYDYIVINDSLETAVDELNSIITAQRLAKPRMTQIIENILNS